MHLYRNSVVTRTLAVTASVLFCFCLTGCGIVKKSTSMKQRLFVRVPGRVPGEADRIARERTVNQGAGGWCFKHVVEAPTTKNGVPVQWYVAWYEGPDKEAAKRNNLKGRRWLLWLPPAPNWKSTREMTVELAEATRATLGAYPQLIEPCLIFDEKYAKVQPPATDPGAKERGQVTMRLGSLPSRVWPSGKDAWGYDPVWFQGLCYSQLAEAKKRVRANPSSAAALRNLRVGILDSGFDSRHIAWPDRATDDVRGDAMQELLPEFADCGQQCAFPRTKPGQSLGSHGTGALGILAGKRLNLDREQCLRLGVKYDARGIEIGGVPEAHIVPVRVAPEMVSMASANFAYGIDYASRVQKCDVLSISHGGCPSQMWADAVNAAYGRGTAMFAATGDYFCFPILPFYLGRLSVSGILPTLPPPSSTVYPAAWRRVIGVAGITQAQKSYACTDYWRWIPNLLWGGDIKDYFMRGSYGADDVRRGPIDGFTFTERMKTDPSMRRRFNELRANPVSAYTPGIPWPVVGHVNEKGPVNRVDLSGGGTSAATPQAAAAAALWLAANKASIPQKDWTTWRKAEAVYTAMTLTAERPWDAKKGKRPEDQRPDALLGAGALKASKMLEISYEAAKAVSGKTLRFPHRGPAAWGEKIEDKEAAKGVPSDFYDGERGFFASVIDPTRYSVVRGRHRVGLREEAYRSEKEAELAYKQLAFNMMLVERWQYGYLPVKQADIGGYPFRRLAGWVGGLVNLGAVNERELDLLSGRQACKFISERDKKHP